MAAHVDILIAGGGPAGLTAAIYARRAGKSVLVLEKENFGGQIAGSPKVENFPGFASISGAELSQRLYDQAWDLGARIELETVEQVLPGAPHTVITDYGTYTCTALIAATGMKHRSLGLDGEETLPGVSFCAVTSMPVIAPFSTVTSTASSPPMPMAAPANTPSCSAGCALAPAQPTRSASASSTESILFIFMCPSSFLTVRKSCICIIRKPNCERNTSIMKKRTKIHIHPCGFIVYSWCFSTKRQEGA